MRGAIYPDGGRRSISSDTGSLLGVFSVILLLVFLPVGRSLDAQSLYSVVDLGPLSDTSGRDVSGPVSINLFGSVAAANALSGFYHAVVYTNGAWVDLGTLGGNESFAGGINESGAVVGYAQTAAGATNAFLWTPGTQSGSTVTPPIQSLGTLGGAVSQAYAINKSGQVAGYSDVPSHAAVQQHAFIYSNGAMNDIGSSLNGLPNSFAYSINDAGHAAGAAYDPAYSAPHLFFFSGSNAIDLGVFGGLGATGLAINNFDNIAGYLTLTSSLDHAFVYLNHTPTDLGTLGGGYSYAFAINNSNVVVGGSFTDQKNSIYHAFSWSQGVLSDLNTRLDPSGVGWTLSEARAINDRGQIAGVGVFDNAKHVFLLTLASTNPPAAPRLSSIRLVGTGVVLQFTTGPGRSYSIQTNASLSGGNWGNTGPVLTGSGSVLTVTNSLTGSPRLFYRVRAF